jgi:hypothetical protein
MKKYIHTVIGIAMLLPSKVFAQTPPDPSPDPFSQSTTEIYRQMMEQNPNDYNAENIVMSFVVEWIYGLVLPILASLAILSIIISGFQLMLSQGNSDSAGNATQRLMGAIMGLILIILIGVILHEVNPHYFQ